MFTKSPNAVLEMNLPPKKNWKCKTARKSCPPPLKPHLFDRQVMCLLKKVMLADDSNNEMAMYLQQAGAFRLDDFLSIEQTMWHDTGANLGQIYSLTAAKEWILQKMKLNGTNNETDCFALTYAKLRSHRLKKSTGKDGALGEEMFACSKFDAAMEQIGVNVICGDNENADFYFDAFRQAGVYHLEDFLEMEKEDWKDLTWHDSDQDRQYNRKNEQFFSWGQINRLVDTRSYIRNEINPFDTKQATRNGLINHRMSKFAKMHTGQESDADNSDSS